MYVLLSIIIYYIYSIYRERVIPQVYKVLHRRLIVKNNLDTHEFSLDLIKWIESLQGRLKNANRTAQPSQHLKQYNVHLTSGFLSKCEYVWALKDISTKCSKMGLFDNFFQLSNRVMRSHFQGESLATQQFHVDVHGARQVVWTPSTWAKSLYPKNSQKNPLTSPYQPSV